nr:hypothetical protein [Tanacetum cinerariifolium]
MKNWKRKKNLSPKKLMLLLIEEDGEEEEIVTKDEVEIIYPYDEKDLNNRIPPTSNDESEFAPSVIPVFDVENRLVPPVIHFSSTYEQDESSSAREILKDISEVDERIVKKIDRSDLCIRMVGCDDMNLDGVVREYQADVSKVISMIESMSLKFDRVRRESRRALELVEWEAGARNATMADDDVEADDVDDDDVEDDDDIDDDATDPSDPQSSEPRGSPPVIAKLVADEVAKALAIDRATRFTTGVGGSSNVGGAGNAEGPERAQPAKDCTFSSFMKWGLIEGF